MPHATPLITTLALGFVLAFACGLLAQRLRLSPLVGYLVAGMLVGPFTPGPTVDPAMAAELAEVGVILLMFGVGLHFSLADLLEVRAVAIPGALFQVGAATALGWALARVLGWDNTQGLVFGLALSAASTVVLLRSLEDHRLLDTRGGRMAIGWLIVEDLLMILVLVLLPVLAQFRVGGAAAGGGGHWLAALAITLGKLVAFVALMLVVGRRVVPWLLERVAGTGSRELFTLCILAMALGVAFATATLFGVSFALGAFFAGMLLNESELSHKAAADSLPMRDAFAVLFFVSVGLLFNPAVLLARPLPVLATLLIVMVGNAGAAWLVTRALGRSQVRALTLAASISQIGEFSFILVGLGMGLGLLPGEARDLVLAAALISISLNPFLFEALARWKQTHPAPSRPAATEESEAMAAGPPGPVTGHTLLIGYGRVGRQIGQLLAARGVALRVMDSEGDCVRQAHRDGLAAVRGNAASAGILEELAPAGAMHAVLAIPNAFEASRIIVRLRELNPALTILARAHSEAEVQLLIERGADATVLAERELAHSMAEMVLNDPRLGQARS